VVALRAHRRLRRADHGRPCRRQRRSGRGRLVRPVKVLIIGSGPILIGQAAEFDYAGTQACRALREEGVETVLVNSNPATIMTDPGVADITYIEPLTVEVLERIIAKERPDGLLPTLGGQTGLTLAAPLAEAGGPEPSLVGWKEIEYEVMRDAADTCITVCNMENLDPMGVHTGDSIVVAPSQTLTDKEYQMLRSAALRIIRALGIEGGCNVQFALHPDRAPSDDPAAQMPYYVIEVNPPVPRSPALASEATASSLALRAAATRSG